MGINISNFLTSQSKNLKMNEFQDLDHIDGISISTVSANLYQNDRDDLVMFYFREGANFASVYTQSKIISENIKWNLSQKTKKIYSLIVNTRNANSFTGEQGYKSMEKIAEEISRQLTEKQKEDEDRPEKIKIKNILFGCTGTIGEKFPETKIMSKISDLMKNIKYTQNKYIWIKAALGIMTTDTRPKGAARQISYAGNSMTINGISKGAGMIKPNMATMLCFVGTDAKLSRELVDNLVKELADQSFNRITIDGDTSTNDACMLFASGKSDAPEIDVNHPDYGVFKEALSEVFVELAQAIVKDGEGATKFISVQIQGAGSKQEALEVAYTIAHSPLIKTAFFASDPNWGRILAALGRANIDNLSLDKVDIYLDDVRIVQAGEKCATYTEEEGQRVMNQDEITISVRLNRGDIEETVWTCDFSHDYVTINAEYRT